MFLKIIEFSSTVFFLLGAVLYTGKKAKNPTRRAVGLFIYLIGGIIYIFWCINVGAWFYFTLQLIFGALDIRGIINCMKERKCSIQPT